MMPLSEHEQRILREIEDNLSASDPSLAKQVSETTLYRHAFRTIIWAALGFVAGLVLLILTFTTSLLVAIIGFGIMLASLLVIERNVRKLGKAGMESLTSSMRSGRLGGMFGDAKRWRERFNRDDS